MTYIICRYILISELRNHHNTKEAKKMTKAEKRAITSRTQDLIKQGVEKEIAEVMARTEFDCGLIRPVVNGNN